MDDYISDRDDHSSDIVDLSSDEEDYEDRYESQLLQDEDDEENGLDFKTRLRYCLDDIQHHGTFSSFQNISAYVNPGLQVKEIGTVGLPLSTRDAQAIARICKQSPFGKGDETLIDETVRKTWELDTNDFTCRNPAWEAFLKSLIKQVIEDLGVQVSVSAQPYKLLLYEEGAFFKAHRDTEKVPGMFGTLVVCLPSEHTGGDVVLVHGKKKRTITTATESAFDLSTLAWYSDVQHEIKPVTSGYRLVLTYNLVQDTMLSKQTATALDASHAKLEKLLCKWHTDDQLRFQNVLIYPLEHQYTPASLSLQHLKGGDAAKGRYLDHSCARNGFYWFLAQMTRTVNEYEEEEGEGGDIELGRAITPSGQVIGLNLHSVTPDKLVVDEKDLYGERSADSEDEGEYTGNENMTTAYRYHDTVALLVRKVHVVKEFCRIEVQSPSSVLGFFELIRDDMFIEVDQRHNFMQSILEKSLSRIENPANESCGRLSYPHYQQMPEAKRLQYVQIFETVSSYCYNHGLETPVGNVLRTASSNKELSKSKDVVRWITRHVAEASSNGKLDALISWFSTTPKSEVSYEYVYTQQKMLNEVEKSLPSTSVSPFNDWMRSRLEILLKAVHSYSVEDVEALWKLISCMSLETYQQIVLPILMENGHQPDVSRLLHVLGTKSDGDPNLRNTVVKPTYMGILAIHTPGLELSAHELTAHSFNFPRGERSSQLSTAAIEILSIIDQCMELRLEGEAATILRTCLPDPPAPGTKGHVHWQSIFRLIPSLVRMVQKHNNSQLNQTASEYISRALKTTSSFLAVSRPKVPLNWSQPDSQRGRCICVACGEVKKFLLNPSQNVGNFSYTERVRKHLEYGFQHHGDFKFETVKGRTPYTLVIYKTRNDYTRKLQEWREVAMEFQKELTFMQSESLFGLLGRNVIGVAGFDDALAAASNTEVVPSKPNVLQTASASSQNQAPHASSSGQIRKVHIVDLTED